MGFFPDDPAPRPAQPEDDAPEPRWMAPPADEVPTLLPLSAVLAADRHAAVLLRGVRVFSDGVEFELMAKLRRADATDDEWDDLSGRFGEFGRRARRDPGRIRVGVILADGRHVLGGRGAGPDDADDVTYRLTRQGGGGTGSDRYQESRWTLWLWPLPPDGPLALVVDWPVFGFGETRFEVDGRGLAGLASATIPIWAEGSAPVGASQPAWTIGAGSGAG